MNCVPDAMWVQLPACEQWLQQHPECVSADQPTEACMRSAPAIECSWYAAMSAIERAEGKAGATMAMPSCSGQQRSAPDRVRGPLIAAGVVVGLVIVAALSSGSR